MVIWAGFIRLKLTFSHGKFYANFEKFRFFFFWWKRPWSLEIYSIAKFITVITLIQTESFQFLSRLCTHLWDIHSLINNSAVIRSGYLYGMSQKMFLNKCFYFCSKFKVFLWNIKIKEIIIHCYQNLRQNT